MKTTPFPYGAVLPIALLAISSAATLPALAQPAAPAAGETVLGQTIIPDLPTEMKVGDLDTSWRRFTAKTDDAAATNMMRMYGGNAQWYDQVMEEMGLGTHYTRGQTTNIGQETYLIAYRVDLGLEPQELQQEIQQRIQAMWGHGQRTPGNGGRIPANSKLKLALLNVREMGSMMNLRAFDAKRDLLSPADLREMSNGNLRRIGQYFQQFSRRNQNLQLSSGDTLRQQLVNNFHAPNNLFLEPESRELYAVNTSLNNRSIATIGNKKAVVAVYEAAPSSDKTRGALFLDGHVERVPEWKWEAVRAHQAAAPTALDLRIMSQQNLQQLRNWLQNIARRGVLSQIKPGATAAQVFASYYGSNPAYTEPASRQPYRVNAALAGKRINDITNKSDVIAFYEPTLGGDGQRGAVYLDGKVRRVADGYWKTAIGAKVQTKK